MYQSGRAGDEAKKRKSPAKSGRVGITACEFMAHYTCKNVEMNLQEIYNYQRIQLSNDKFTNGILAGMLDLA